MKMPSIKSVQRNLQQFKNEMEAGNDCEVRLQVLDESDGVWELHYGDPQYDQDHRGFWGVGNIDKSTNCRELAKQLIEDCLGNM